MKKGIIIVLLFFICINFVDAVTVDSISNSGILSDGGSFSISGGDFGVKGSTPEEVAPLVWETFEDGQNGQLIVNDATWRVECLLAMNQLR